MFKNVNQKYRFNDSRSLMTSNSYQNSYRRNYLYENNYHNSSMESNNSHLIRECSLINEEKLKLQNDLNKMDEKYKKIKEQFNIENSNLKNVINEKSIGNKILIEKNKKMNLILDDKNLEIENMKNIIKEKDKLIFELKEDNKNKENIINSLNNDKNQELKNIYNLKENLNNLDRIQNKNMTTIKLLNNDKQNLLKQIEELEYEKEKMRGQIKLMEYNLGDLTKKLKEANNTIIKLNKNLEIKGQINIKKEEENKKQINYFNELLENKENIILKLINQMEIIIQRDKNIKKILFSNNTDNNNDIYNINNKKELEQLWNSFEKYINIQ